jgi:hypothetical protein
MSVQPINYVTRVGTTTDAFSSYELSCPIIGYQNLLTAANVTASDANPDFPATNLANPATHLKWKGTNTTSKNIIFDTVRTGEIDYLAIAGHNFGSISANLFVYSDAHAGSLPFDGTNGSTTISADGYAVQTWTAHGNAQLSTAQFKFGGSSLLCDGAGDYVDTPDNDSIWNLDSYPFTIDMWVRPNASGALNIAGQVDSLGLSNSDSAWRLRKDASNHLEAAVVQGTTVTTLTGTTTMSNATWYHIALVRSSDDRLYLFLNGVLEATAAFTGSINNSTEPMTVGRGGSQTGSEWNGWIDSFHFFFGAIWTSNFTPPTSAWAKSLVSDFSPTDDGPIIFRFSLPMTIGQFFLFFNTMTDIPEAAVIYTGQLLVIERSIKLDPWHVPINLGRKTNMVNGMSESGNFLGRIVLGQYSETKASFQYITQDWYRDNMDDFVIAAKEAPFFWAWNPTENPTDVGYSWLTADPQPAIDPVTRRVEIELNMRAVTE